MADASLDENFIPVALAVSATDDTVTIPVQVNPVNGALQIEPA